MKVPTNLYNSSPPTDSDLHDFETWLYGAPNTIEKDVGLRLLHECRSLKHQLNDPNYNYSGRIHRAAILCRDAEIDSLRDEITQLKAKLETSK